MTKKIYLLLPVFALVLSCSHRIYVVRHAEKAAQGSSMMSSDVPLTDQGKARAVELRELLKKQRIRRVYSTNTIRTRSTAQPTADYFHLAITGYGPRPDSAFLASARSARKNILIVGHSNTVDEIVNGLCGRVVMTGDLPDSVYNKLLIVKIRGKKSYFSERKFEPR